jgi:hypothetical protein
MWVGKAEVTLPHVYDVNAWPGALIKENVSAGSRWLKARGIHLILAACPTMPTVYAEQFVEHCPPNGVFATHIRETLVDSLDMDTEVVDVLSLMRANREGPFQFLPADSHWSEAGMMPVVREIADRLERYDFGLQAKLSLPVTKTTTGPYFVPSPFDDPEQPWRPQGSESIRAEQRADVDRAWPKKMAVITAADGSPLLDDPASPIMLIGDSLCWHFRELLMRECNMRIRTHSVQDQNVRAFEDFLRDPSLLDGVYVVIWVTSEERVSHWRHLPTAILAALGKP